MTTYHFLVRSLSQQLNKALTLGTKRHPFGRHHGIYSIGKPWTSEHHQKSHLMPSNMSFLLKSRTLSHLTQKKSDHLLLKGFSTTNVNHTWSNHCPHPNSRSVLLTTLQIMDLPFKVANSQPSQTLGIKDYTNYVMIGAVTNEAPFLSPPQLHYR